MINRVVLVGRLTRDPELRKTNSDVAVASFTLAVDDRSKNAEGKQNTNFIPVTVWREQATNVCKFVRKGSLVGVDGRIVQRSFERKDGTKASALEVVADSVKFLEPKGAKNNAEAPKDDINQVEPEEKEMKGVDIVDDDLPF
ncbi:MAG: single-stranded DNA-binding protein [Bacilli bacterium]|nr:single-stranded DNA-binding protein [Bacilli bacterium]